MSAELVLIFHGIGRPPACAPENERAYWIAETDFAALLAGAAARTQEFGISYRVEELNKVLALREAAHSGR